ncbi:hypothetical protein NKH77_01065 [Streptomyces sp. M19]
MNAEGPLSGAAAARGFRPITPAQGLGSLSLARAVPPQVLIGLDGRNPRISPLLTGAATRRAVLVGYTGSVPADEVRRAVAEAAGPDFVPLAASVPRLPRPVTRPTPPNSRGSHCGTAAPHARPPREGWRPNWPGSSPTSWAAGSSDGTRASSRSASTH